MSHDRAAPTEDASTPIQVVSASSIAVAADHADGRAGHDSKQFRKQAAVGAAEDDGAARISVADRDEGCGGAGVTAPVEQGADGEEDEEPDDRTDRRHGVGGVVLQVNDDDGDDVEISLWNGTAPTCCRPPRTRRSREHSSAPARKMARPLVHVRRYSTA